VIISSLSEPNPSSDADRETVCEIINYHLSYDIRDKIVKTKRLGTFLNGPKPRRVLPILDSPSVAAEVLSRARLLRESSDAY